MQDQQVEAQIRLVAVKQHGVRDVPVSRHRRRHVHSAGTGVPVLKMISEAVVLSTGTPIPARWTCHRRCRDAYNYTDGSWLEMQDQQVEAQIRLVAVEVRDIPL